MHRGAQQPGMTGQVKEDILVRFGVLGVFVKEGKLCFNPVLLRNQEFLNEEQSFEYRNCRGDFREIKLSDGQLAFTCYQTPVIFSLSETDSITVYYTGGNKETIAGKTLNREISSEIFRRTGAIEKLEVSVSKNI